MTLTLIIIFALTYAAIALEDLLKISKSATALIGAGLLWSIYALSIANTHLIDEQLAHSLKDAAQIAFFLMGAMTIVEVIDIHDGFNVITTRISAKSLSVLVWIIAFVTFFLSAILDNLTTTIVMVSLMKKLLAERRDRLMFAGLIIIASNAGGAWSPIGDVTTTMLWIGGQVTSTEVIKGVFLASFVNMIIPAAYLSYVMRGKLVKLPAEATQTENYQTRVFERNVIFGLGLAILIMVPVFKAVTHLPPYLGILLGLGILWAVGDLIHRNKEEPTRKHMAIAHALSRIDMGVIVFFIGILLAVATLEHTDILSGAALMFDKTIGRLDVIVMVLGLVSAVIDNVPIVAASMGMYSLETHPTDSFLWEFMAYCAGTGGSILIIGSAAGVAAMGLEKISFLWYLRKFAPLALFAYFAGALTYLGQYYLTH
ncbi:MAG: sodium:proton antiporter NhaD [Pseudomonadota bacterium]